MKMWVFLAFASCMASYLLGWMTGATLTASQIADAITSGELSLDQPPRIIARQIERGIYFPGRR